MLKSIPWGEIIEAIFRRRGIVALVALVIIGLSMLSAWLRPKTFEAAARIQLTADAVSGPRGAAMSDKQVQAELAFLRSPALISRVLTALGEDNERADRRPSLRGRIIRIRKDLRQRFAALAGRTEADRFERRVRATADSIEVEPIGRSNLVEIAYSSSNPAFAADFVNGLLIEHVERIAELGRESPELPFIESQLDFLVQRWQDARHALDEFRSRHGTSVLAGDENQVRGLVANLEAQRVGAETNVLELAARVEYLDGQKVDYPATVETELRTAEPEAVKLLEARITELQMDRSEALTRYTPTSVVVRQYDRQIEEAQRLLSTKERQTFFESATSRNPAFAALEVEQLQTMAQLKAAEARVSALSDQIRTYRGRLGELELTVVEFDRLQNQVDSAQEAYQDYLRDAETARKATARDDFGMVNIAVIEPAKPPRISRPSGAKLRVAAGFLAGLILGVAAALLRDWLEPSVKGAAEASRLTGLPILAEIPYQ